MKDNLIATQAQQEGQRKLISALEASEFTTTFKYPTIKQHLKTPKSPAKATSMDLQNCARKTNNLIHSLEIDCKAEKYVSQRNIYRHYFMDKIIKLLTHDVGLEWSHFS